MESLWLEYAWALLILIGLEGFLWPTMHLY